MDWPSSACTASLLPNASQRYNDVPTVYLRRSCVHGRLIQSQLGEEAVSNAAFKHLSTLYALITPRAMVGMD